MQHVLDKRDGTRRIEHGAARFAQRANPRQHPMQVDGRRWFGLNQQVIGAGVGKSFEVALGFDDHQMHIERLCGRAAHGAHDRGTE
jgi:hypothetical protein